MKSKKIKRYGNSIFSNRRSGVAWKVTAWVVALGVLFYGGYYLADLVLSKDRTQKPTSKPGTEQTSKTPGTTNSESTSQQPEASNPQTTAAVRGIRCTVKTMQSRSDLEKFLDTAKQDGYNAIFFDAKAADGKVSFATKTAVGTAAKAAIDQPIDLADVVKLLQDKKMTGIPVIHAFEDPLAAGKVRKAAIWYNNGVEEYLWLDNYADQGGKAWLNPYSADARGYITALQDELYTAGFSTVMLDSVQFGSILNNELAYYGEESKNTTRVQILTTFVSECQTVADKHKATVCFSMPVKDLIEKTSTNLDGSFLDCKPASVAPVFTLSELGNKLQLGSVSVEKPGDKPAETTKAVMDYLKNKLPDCKWTAIFADYENIAKQQMDALGNAASCLVEKVS